MYRPRRLHALQWAMLLFAALATGSAQLGWSSAYALLKPLPLLLLIACVWQLADRTRQPRSTWLLLAGLAFSLQGDVWLLLSSGFIAGLLSFWLAHACYIALLRRDTPWRAGSWAWAVVACTATGAALYAFLWQHGLPSSMRLPVAAYVLVIAAMAAQAIARAAAQGTAGAYCVAAGALLFMLSDTLLAINRFVQPLPMAQLGVLGSYYLAQWLIVHGMLAVLRKDTATTAPPQADGAVSRAI